MRDFGSAAMAEIEAGTALSVGAVRLATLEGDTGMWGGPGPLEMDGLTYKGVLNHGLVTVTGGSLTSTEQSIEISLSGVDPDALALYDFAGVRRAPAVIHRLIFDASGRTLLAAPVYVRGRLDKLTRKVSGGVAVIRALIETAARGLGRFRVRMRSLGDQQLIDPEDDGMKSVNYAGNATVYFGGKPPASAAVIFEAAPIGSAGSYDSAI